MTGLFAPELAPTKTVPEGVWSCQSCWQVRGLLINMKSLPNHCQSKSCNSEHLYPYMLYYILYMCYIMLNKYIYICYVYIYVCFIYTITTIVPKSVSAVRSHLPNIPGLRASPAPPRGRAASGWRPTSEPTTSGHRPPNQGQCQWEEDAIWYIYIYRYIYIYIYIYIYMILYDMYIYI